MCDDQLDMFNDNNEPMGDLEIMIEADSKKRLEALKQLSIKIRNSNSKNIENADYTTKKRLQENCD